MNLFKIITYIALILVGCSDSSFSGSGATKAPEQQTMQNQATQDSDATLGTPQSGEDTENNQSTIDIFDDLDSNVDTTNQVDLSNNLQPVVIPQVTFTPPPVVTPVEIVDGQEVFTDCKSCLLRAQALSPQLGFKAEMSKTYNLGFYKINPSRNLCDVHFMNNMSTPIDDHEGQDTLGNGQLIMYCPCNCNWASDTPPPNDPFYP